MSIEHRSLSIHSIQSFTCYNLQYFRLTEMITTILLFILSFRTINSTGKAWDMSSPLILNKNGDDIFFPRYVAESTTSNSPANQSIIVYKEPADRTTLTYTFCKDPTSTLDNVAILKGTLLEESLEPGCQDSEQYFIRGGVKDKDGKLILCGSKNKKSSTTIMYSVFLKLKIDERIYQLDLYEYCYDEINAQNTLYAHFDLDNPSLLGNKLLAEERNYDFNMKKVQPSVSQDFQEETISSADSYTIQNVYRAYEVAVSNFIPFGYWKSSFYQWHNLAPMNSDLVPAFNLLVINLQLKLSKTNQPLKIYSGIYEVLRMKGSLQYLPNKKTPIPAFWWILFYNKDKTQGISLIMHNYSYAFGEKKLDPLCGVSVCGDVGLQTVIPQGEGYNQASIYCCPASTIATKFDFYQDDELLKFNDENSNAI